VTTPDVRAWARENGYEVSDRGRLPAEVREAYTRAQKQKPPAKQAGKKATPTRAGAKKATGTTNGQRVAPQPDLAASAAPDETGTRQPAAQPTPVSDDRRLVALAEELKALTARVDALEKAAAGNGGKAPRFRRKKG
jgi:hypothetical protein